MSDMRDKLQALAGHPGIMIGGEWRQRIDELAQRRASGEFEIDRVVTGDVVENELGSFYLVRHEFPLAMRHGSLELGAALDCAAHHIAFSANDDELVDFDPRTCFFVDTETGGLSGGTGTVAFLVGIGYFTGDVFRVDQCFMRDFDDEEAMLSYLGTLFRECDAVCSYNGKSFDLPLLRTRFIQNRVPFRLDGLLHLDLLHAARRFWKLRLRDCSLGNVEREVLGFHRTGDVPSWEIPQIWFDYLRTRDARRLEAVFYHHRCDILSLAVLTAHLSQTLAQPDGQGFAYNEDRLSLARLCLRRKQFEDAAAQARRLLEEDPSETLLCECLDLLATALKRLQAWAELEEVLSYRLREAPSHMPTRIELAKVYEHRLRNLAAAETVCTEGLDLLDQSANAPALSREAYRHELARRLDRIRAKRARYGLSVMDHEA